LNRHKGIPLFRFLERKLGKELCGKLCFPSAHNWKDIEFPEAIIFKENA
jgi:hypothetical protein